MAKLCMILSFLLAFTADQPKLVKTKIGEHITVSLPESFFPMSVSDMSQRYPSVRKPLGAYTNMERMVDFSVNVSATQWRESDVAMAKDFFKASLLNLYDRTKLLKEEIVTLDDKQFIVFEFESRINGEQYSFEEKDPIRRYSYVQYLIINGKTLVFSFNSPIQLKEQWQDTALEVMNSVKVKKGI